jgi:aminopeptidase N
VFPANITREEAQVRAKLIQTESYQVLIDASGRALNGIEPTTQFLTSTVVHFTSKEADTDINIIADKVLNANLDGVNLPEEAFSGERLSFHVDEGEHDLIVNAVMRYSRTGEGLHRFVDPVDGEVYLYTQQEPADARRVFPCFEQPDEKARFQFSVMVPEGWTVITNADKVEPQKVEEGVVRFDFPFTERISTYLTAIIAGRFHVVEDVYKGAFKSVPLSVACRQSLAPYLDAERIFTTTKRGIAVYEEEFGHEYPFPHYGQIFVPEFNAGAMENPGAITIRDEYLYRSRATAAEYETRDNTILHEMAHMWFGDYVTMKWWDDLWLNESFAEWASHYTQAKIHEATGEGDDPWATFANARKNWAYRQDQLPTTHPIAADMYDLEAVELNFDGITYAKGASTLKQLVAFVGEPAFCAGVREYFNKNAWGNAELADLLKELEASSGRDLSRFTLEWLQTPGVNTLRPKFTVEDGKFTSFEIEQEADPRFPVLRQHRLAVGLYNRVDGKLTRTFRVETDIDGASTAIPELLGQTQPDLVLLNDDDLTYAKVRLDERSVKTLVEGLRDLDSTLARALAWGSLYDMCRDGELPASQYVDLVLANIATETDTTAVNSQLSYCVQFINQYAPRPADALLARFSEGVHQLMMKAEPGSDLQLAFARYFIATDRSAEGALLLQRWLFSDSLEGIVFYYDTPAYRKIVNEVRDGLVPEGLAIDTDLRWRIVTALAGRGIFGEEEIAAEAQIDPTAQGSERAAGARAARPDADAKAEAWKRLTDQADETPNETYYQICTNFFRFGQDDVLAQYLPKYQELVGAVSDGSDGWGSRSSALRQDVVGVLFPQALVNDENLPALQSWFANAKFSNFVKRAISERLDDAQRAYRARQAA